MAVGHENDKLFLPFSDVNMTGECNVWYVAGCEGINNAEHVKVWITKAKAGVGRNSVADRETERRE